MAALVSHAMHRFPTSPPDAVYSSYGLRGENKGRHGGDVTSDHRPVPSSSSTGALSRSMRYAEPWLYGSVRASGGLFLAPALVLCQCPEYLTGSRRSSSSSKKSPHVCKKCKGTRLPLSSADSKFGTVRCYPTTQPIGASTPLRAGTVRVTSSSSRPSILPTSDPYDLMRRSRLSVPETNLTTSPFREKTTPSPTKTVKDGPKRSSSGNRSKGRKDDKPHNATFGRRSILECDVNPYELMSTGAYKEAKSSKSGKNATILNVHRMKAPQQNHEDMQVSKNCKTTASKKPSPVRIISTPTKPDKEQENKFNTLTTNPFKSILKKTNHSSDSSPYSDAEETVSPTFSPKSSSKFYVPVSMPLTPRKKVQFLDSHTSESSEDEEVANNDGGSEDNVSDTTTPRDAFEKPEVQSEEDEDVFEDALQGNEPVQKTSNGEKEDDLRRRVKVQRSNSDRANTDLYHVDFYDTMALRQRKRGDSRLAFADKDLEKLDGLNSKTRKISFSKNNHTSAESSSDTNQEKEPEVTKEETPDTVSGNVTEVSKEQLTQIDEAPSAPPRKRGGHNKQPTVKIVTSPSPEVKRTESFNKTVLQISSPTPVHKIQIKNEFPEYNHASNTQNIMIFENSQRKTSILINGDDCYSTVNVNDNVPLYQSSVVVNDDNSAAQQSPKHNSSKIYITGTFISTSEPSPSEVQVAAIKESIKTPIDPPESEAPIVAQNTATHQITESEPSESAPNLTELLRDPVEAIRLNLVPHVCGKSDVARRQRDTKFPGHTQPLARTESLLESPLEEANLPKSVEDSFLRLRKYESIGEPVEYDDVGSENNSSQYELMDQGSECYTDHSNRSSVTEEELANRTKFYELLTESDNIEVSESDEHHYESIKVNNDPIYEEIELPPPLPANPPPSMILDDLQLDKEYTTRSIFEGASKYDILSYLVDAKERGIVQEEGYTYNYSANSNNDDETKEPYNRVSHMSTVSDSSEDNSLIISGLLIDEKATTQKPAEVERNDSGVGSETSKSSLSKYRSKPEIFVSCEDCDASLDSKTENDPLLCKKCVKKRSERKEIITEIVETEEKYSRDLQIILEEFYQPMLVAGLLTADQLSAIFLNAEELLENSQALAERLRDAVEIALEQGDDDLLTVNIGRLFLEAAPMLHAFETYCVRQGTASLLLASLEKEKELLRIFLRVSQMENTMLRRMNLNSFLMVPVQRVTKYPLLLSRLYKVTPSHHETRDQLKDAQHKIELHLNHMNSETKDVPSKLWRRIGNSSGRRPSTEMDLVNIKLRKIAVDVLEWNHEEARFMLEGKLLFTQPTDNNWRKGRTIKLAPVNALLVINGKTPANKPPSDKGDESALVFSPRNSGVREAALLLVRDKNGRYSLLREPLYLDRCVIAADPAWQSYFEVQEIMSKDTFIFKADDEDQTQVWYKKLQYHAQGMGPWRKRRNALANIMINGMGLRS